MTLHPATDCDIRWMLPLLVFTVYQSIS